MFTIATWNINSVRLREALVTRLLTEEAPDILCLQEIKTPIDKFPVDGFAALGYRHLVARGQKGYNGVAILSKLPIEDAGDRDYANLGHARHVAARLHGRGGGRGGVDVGPAVAPGDQIGAKRARAGGVQPARGVQQRGKQGSLGSIE